MGDTFTSASHRYFRHDAGFSLDDLVYNSAVPIYACNREGVITFYNAAAVVLWGRTPDVKKDRWSGAYKMYYSDGSELPLEQSPTALAATGMNVLVEAEVIIERPDGTIKKVLSFPRAIRNAAGQVVGAHTTLIDITEKASLEERQAFLSSIIASSDDAIVSKSLEGIITSWNIGAERLFGYAAEEVIGKSITILIPKSRLSEEEYILGQIRKGEKVDHYQTVRLNKYGKELLVSLTVSPIKDKQGRLIGASKIARDISDEVKVQNAIYQYTRDLEALNSISQTISSKLDVQSTLQQVTDASREVTGAAYGTFFYNLVDEDGTANIRFTVSGYPEEAAKHLPIPRDTALLHPTFNGTEIVRSDDITKDPRYGQNQPFYGMPGGHPQVVSYLAAPVVSAKGVVMGALFLGHPEPGKFSLHHESLISNITAQAAVALDNSRLFEEVKALNAKKDEFIALASHELKTPLTSVYGYLQLLAKGPDSKMTSLFVDKGLKQLDKLNKLVSELLDVSKIEAGKLQFNTEFFDLNELLHETVEAFSFSINSHRIILDAQETPVYIKADKERIEQVIINFLSNAVKYSPDADRVWVGCKRKEGSVEISIKDKGIGLTPSQQQKIFTRFYRADNTSGISGLGIGLYLSREIVERHAGTIQLTSEYGKGSEFVISLPLPKN
ncbi:PAS domain S-box protein [Olivibacter sp. XZL3]|uniref:sensor histidine kinase n=1 Tax=Olivibacter sp. XZL3 TaxID=1735116 RepID=UPI001064D71E|nr:PAS domain S-box protein [Olivibacter sp. XZL3]